MKNERDLRNSFKAARRDTHGNYIENSLGNGCKVYLRETVVKVVINLSRLVYNNILIGKRVIRTIKLACKTSMHAGKTSCLITSDNAFFMDPPVELTRQVIRCMCYC